MEAWLTDILQWVETNPQYAAFTILLVAFAESLAVIGVILPGAFLMFGFGTLIGAGLLPFWPMAICAVFGAILGDGVSYGLGYTSRQRIRSWPPFKQHPAMIDDGHAFFVKYGSASIFLGRFIGPLRPIIPLIAGMLDMPVRRFFAFNVLSALIWGPAYLLPGMLLGQNMEEANGLLIRWLIVVTVITVSIPVIRAITKRTGLLLVGITSTVVVLFLAIFAYVALRPHSTTLEASQTIASAWQPLPNNTWQAWANWINPNTEVIHSAIITRAGENQRYYRRINDGVCLLRVSKTRNFMEVSEIYRQDWGIVIATRERKNPACSKALSTEQDTTQ